MEPEESMACPVCGGELQPHIICPFCGTDITLKSLEGLEPTYKCPVCGKEAQTKFICNECGSEFKYELILKKMEEFKLEKKEEKRPVAKKSTPGAETLVELKGGLTNGLTAKRGREKGLTNGLTNGLGKKEKGLTNGLKGGMVNGTGVTNGTKPPKRPKKKEKPSKVPVAIAAVLVVILIAGSFYFMLMPQKAGMRVDGDFSDWKTSLMREEPMPASNPMDMVRYASTVSDGFVYIYLEGRSNLFSVDGSRIYAFIDSDGNEGTGYRINGIGADYLCKIYGENGKIGPHAAYSYSGDGFTWEWTSYGVLFADYKNNKLEMAFAPDSIDKDYRIAFYTSDSQEHHYISSVNIGEEPSVYFCAKPSEDKEDIYMSSNESYHLMDIEIFSTGGDVTVDAITLTADDISEATLRDSSGNTVATMDNSRFSLNLELRDGEKLNYQVWGRVSGVNGSLISLDITQVIVSPASAIIRTEIEPFKAYFGEPTGIKIDGAFGDWENMDIRQDPEDMAENQDHIDIIEYAGTKEYNSLYFYLGVKGDIMAGVLVPEKYAQGIPNQNITHIPKGPNGEDILRVYINTGKDTYRLEVLGKEGKIISTTLSHRDGDTWREISTTSEDLKVAKDSSRMEGGIPLSLLGNPGSFTMKFEMSDWEGHRDSTEKITPYITGTGLTRSTEDITPVPEFQGILIPMLISAAIGIVVIRRRK